MDKTYINSLLKKNPRELDLYDIKDILAALVDTDIDAWQAMDFMDKEEKNLFSKIRNDFREELVAGGKKPTESWLEDLVRTSKEWLDHLVKEKEVDKAGKLFRESYKKWERCFSARMMKDSKDNKQILI
jgi:hypothetical protein